MPNNLTRSIGTCRRVKSSKTAEPNPPATAFSSTVTNPPGNLASCSTNSSSNGFTKRASATVTAVPRAASSSAAESAVLTILPMASIPASFPSRRISPLPNGTVRGFTFLPGAAVAPLGYRIATGRASCKAVHNISRNAAPSRGAITTILGNVRRNDKSSTPWCVGPSSPTMPARSKQKITGRFCSATSCTI